jgi:hypothetical protein
MDPPRAFAKSQTHPPTIRLFCLALFFSTISGVSRQGEFKNTIQIFLQKAHALRTFWLLYTMAGGWHRGRACVLVLFVFNRRPLFPCLIGF